MDPITDKYQELFSHNKRNENIMCVGDTIMAAAAEAGIDGNWCILNNQSTCNTFVNIKYMSNIRDISDGLYLCAQ